MATNIINETTPVNNSTPLLNTKIAATNVQPVIVAKNPPHTKNVNSKTRKIHKAKATNETYANCYGTHGRNGQVTLKSVGAGALSLLIWPGLGQLVNDGPSAKAGTHAILGLIDIFRIWSCYDAVVDRHGGVWENRI